MPIMWSRLHAELGLSPTPLTHAMVVQAVEAGMAEADDLDWKQALPPEVEKKRLEFAKDIAAMANTRGGLIIHGVREENERAVGLTGVSNGERNRQALRSFANRYVRPLVDGLLIEALDGEDGEPGLIAVFVPPSPDAPHVIGEKNEMGIPYRYGTDTNWMSEGQLERAYRDRFTRRGDDRAALSALIDGLVPEIDLLQGVWVAVVARPVAPLPLLSGRQERAQATATMLNAMELVAEVFGKSQGRVPVLTELLSDGAIINPRNGLRRWVIRSNHYSTDPHELVDCALVELHHDGSVALAMGLFPFLRGVRVSDQVTDVRPVPVRVVDAVIAEAIALASTHVRGLGGVGTIVTCATLLWDDRPRSLPLMAIDNRMFGGAQNSLYHPVQEARGVRNLLAVEVSFSADDDVAALRGAARQLADDLSQQFGMPGSSIPE
ncbi:MAG: ATP-binding protein [Actinomycetota bacterium]|nr:ATP-binding protein [Actinomycetota bacterium]